MAGMSIQDRYDDISRISGLSEDVVRRVLKATRESMAKSIKHGERVTLPGIVTMTPVLKNRIDLGGQSMTSYIKIKASASPALTTELEKLDKFISKEEEDAQLAIENNGLQRLNLVNPELRTRFDRNNRESDGVLTNQISALL